MKYIIIGGGISGLSVARMLRELGEEVVIFEKENRPGGLIRCERVEGNLFHCTGGHVFNTKRHDVMDWFWRQFDRDKEFTKAQRYSSVAMDDGKMIPYPIENHIYFFEEIIQKSFIADLLTISRESNQDPKNFEEFLRARFGETLYQLYFKPYNYKVWRRDLAKIPLSWLEGKLPMPSVEEMIFNNINHVEERSFVHSSFYYPVNNGSQFLADRIAQGIDIRYNRYVQSIERCGTKWIVDDETTDRVIFCGNIKQLPKLISGQCDISGYISDIETLEYHGTTAVFCEIDANPYSWVYQPSSLHESHRIICTGNFAASNNADGKMTATIEFTDAISKECILENLVNIPYHPKYLAHHFEKYTYPIQSRSTGEMVKQLKNKLETENFFLLGRFAEWEYYNMDVAMGAAIDLLKKL